MNIFAYDKGAPFSSVCSVRVKQTGVLTETAEQADIGWKNREMVGWKNGQTNR